MLKVHSYGFVSLILNLAHLSPVFVFKIIPSIVFFNNVHRHVIHIFYLSVDPRDVRFREMSRLVAAKNINESILKQTSCCMVSTFIQFCFELEPSISCDIVSLHCSLTALELLELDESLVATTSYCVNVPIASQAVGEVCSTSMHEFPLFQHIPFQDVFVILGRVCTSHHESSEFDVGDNSLVPLGLHGRRNLDFLYRPRVVGPGVIKPNFAVKEGAKLIPRRLGLARG